MRGKCPKLRHSRHKTRCGIGFAVVLAMRSNLTPMYVFILLGAFAVGLGGTLLAARSLLPAPAVLPAQAPRLPGVQQPTRLPVLPLPPAAFTTEC